jgi:hypothetical protein
VFLYAGRHSSIQRQSRNSPFHSPDKQTAQTIQHKDKQKRKRGKESVGGIISIFYPPFLFRIFIFDVPLPVFKRKINV